MKQNVDVVFRSANRERNHLVILGNPCQVGPQARLKVLRNGIAAIFGAEDHVDVIPGKCMCQCVAPPGLYAIASWLPTAATTPACTKAAQAGDPGSTTPACTKAAQAGDPGSTTPACAKEPHAGDPGSAVG
jgi:hypothetical protein